MSPEGRMTHPEEKMTFLKDGLIALEDEQWVLKTG